MDAKAEPEAATAAEAATRQRSDVIEVSKGMTIKLVRVGNDQDECAGEKDICWHVRVASEYTNQSRIVCAKNKASPSRFARNKTNSGIKPIRYIFIKFFLHTI